MIDINYDDSTSVVRSNIGDPKARFVTDSTILSALSKYDGDEIKASILIMETMLKWFSTQADESKTDQVEYKYTKLYERYKAQLQEFKSEKASSSKIPIIIGGTILSQKNAVAEDVDVFLPYMLDDWQKLQSHRRLIDEDERYY